MRVLEGALGNAAAACFGGRCRKSAQQSRLSKTTRGEWDGDAVGCVLDAHQQSRRKLRRVGGGRRALGAEWKLLGAGKKREGEGTGVVFFCWWATHAQGRRQAKAGALTNSGWRRGAARTAVSTFPALLLQSLLFDFSCGPAGVLIKPQAPRLATRCQLATAGDYV